jgi:hypothetical protein
LTGFHRGYGKRALLETLLVDGGPVVAYSPGFAPAVTV